MVFGDAESVSGVKKYFNHNKHIKGKVATNPDKNIKKPCKIPYQPICNP